MLRGENEADRSFQRLVQVFVPGHSKGFAQGNRGNAVAIELGVDGLVGFIAEQSPIRLLIGDQPAEAGADLVPILVVDVGISLAEKREQGQAGSGRVGIHLAQPGVGRRGDDSRRQPIEGPAPVGKLAARKEVQPLFDGAV